MGNFKVGDTFDDIKASFLRKERVSLQNSNENGANYITDATVDDIIRHHAWYRCWFMDAYWWFDW